MKKIKKILILFVSLFMITGCDIFKSDLMDEIDVYTTTYPINYLIKYLYNDHSTIYSIYPNGVNFKGYELSDKKIKEFAKSDLFVFDSQDNDKDYALKMLNENRNLKLIDTALGMKYDYAIQELWLNPYNYLMMAKNIRDSFNEYITNPYLVEEINDNYETLKYELSRLDANYQDVLRNGNYDVIVADNSLFKFLEKYDVEVIVLEENIVTVTIKDNMSISDIANTYNVTVSDILTYNNKVSENVSVGEKIMVPIRTIDTSDVNKVKKLISENKIKYVYSNSENTNEIVEKLINDNKLELVAINDLYSIDGGITNSNESYLTIMNDNLELLKKELYK